MLLSALGHVLPQIILQLMSLLLQLLHLGEARVQEGVVLVQ